MVLFEKSSNKTKGAVQREKILKKLRETFAKLKSLLQFAAVLQKDMIFAFLLSIHSCFFTF